MQNKPPTSRWSARVRIALIPGLAAVLIGVLCWPSTEPGSVEPSTVVTAASPSAPQPASDPGLEQTWKDIEIAQAKENNPFAGLGLPNASQALELNPESASQQTPSNRSSSQLDDAATIRTLRVQAVLHTEDGFCAVIDGKVVRIGDSLPDGIKVLAISHDGIVVRAD